MSYCSLGISENGIWWQWLEGKTITKKNNNNNWCSHSQEPLTMRPWSYLYKGFYYLRKRRIEKLSKWLHILG